MIRSSLLTLVAVSCIAGTACAPATKIDARPVLVDLEGTEIDPLSTGAAATVLLFARSDCPISNRYAPELQRIHGLFASRGVEFWHVYADPDEPRDVIEKHTAEYGPPGRPVYDPQHAFVELIGATVTPEVAVFNAEGKLVYVGRIDDRFVAFGKARAAATEHDLVDTLEAVLAGRRTDLRRTQAIGCFIPDLD